MFIYQIKIYNNVLRDIILHSSFVRIVIEKTNVSVDCLRIDG